GPGGDRAGSSTGLARLVQFERDGLAGPLKRLLEGQFDRGLDVVALAGPEARPAPVGAAQIAEVAELHVPRPTAGASRAALQIAENAAEKVGEPARVAELLEPDLPSLEGRTSPGSGVRVPLPVGPQGVVAFALFRIGEHRVRFVDLLEAVRGAFVDVRVVLARQSPIRGLDRLVVGGLRHP